MMKTQTSSYGFEVLVTYLLPGITALVAVLIAHGVNIEIAKKFLDWAAEAQFLSTFLIFAGIALMGAIVATGQAILETHILDRITPKRLKITAEEFTQEWVEYVKALPNSKNSYISRVVLFFQFETRMGLSFMILGGFLFRSSCAHAIAALATGAILYAVGMAHHRELADYRHRCWAIVLFLLATSVLCLYIYLWRSVVRAKRDDPRHERQQLLYDISVFCGFQP